MQQDNNIQQAKSRFGIVGNAPALTEAVSRAIRVAPIDLSVLVVGESGTGKEFFPQIIHAYSPRKHSRYIAVNCGAIPEGTIDSELFGHEKGAFTGAVATRKGYFEEANGGTIFLDEVAELPLTTQARLLRVLESGEFMKVGSSVVQKTNIRVVAATNVDMEKAVREGRFREDLYYRLSTVQIQVPPLRDRGTDIVLLARKFASDFAERYRTKAIAFSDSGREALMAYRWPGNVRQLKNVVEQVALFDAGESIDEDILRGYLPDITVGYTPILSSEAHAHSYEREREMLFNMIIALQGEIAALRQQMSGTQSANTGVGQTGLRADSLDHLKMHTDSLPGSALVKYSDMPSQIFASPVSATEAGHTEDPIDVTHTVVNMARPTLEQTEREIIRLSLERNGGRRKATAAELNISERTLYRKIKEYGLE